MGEKVVEDPNKSVENSAVDKDMGKEVSPSAEQGPAVQENGVKENGNVNGHKENGDVHEDVEEEDKPIPIPPITIHLPKPTHSRTVPKSDSNASSTIILHPQPNETIQELKLIINEWVGGYWLGPYSLRITASGAEEDGEGGGGLRRKTKDGAEIREGERLSEWLEVGDVFGEEERVLEVVREPYSDLSARQAVLRFTEIISPSGTSSAFGLNPGSTIFESIRDSGNEIKLVQKKKGKKDSVKREVKNPFEGWSTSLETPFSKLQFTQPASTSLPCVKSIQLSPLNPPPPHLRQKGHQLYLQITLLEGDVLTLVCISRGWTVSNDKLEIGTTTHSLFDLVHSLSPLFSERLALLPPLSAPSEPISTIPIPQADPSYPWLTTPTLPTGDFLRTQLAYLHTGATTPDGLDAARDWNEEIQGIKEMPHSTMQERVVREKLAQKTWAEYSQAATRAVLAVARGDIVPLNPNEHPRAHMWLMSNIFVTKAIDSIDTYAHLGGDEAAFVSHGKDAAGVKVLNKLDIDGVHLLGHVVVDWAGDRWVCQSMLPGIFSRREEPWVDVDKEQEVAENHLIIYGVDSEHQTCLHWDEPTHKVMEKVAVAHRLAEHKVKDGRGEAKDYWASVEVKVLRGTDGRRYLLDLPRLNPVDVEWLEKDIEGYPHRVVLLRQELVHSFWENELKQWIRGQEKPEEADLKDFTLKFNADAFVDKTTAVIEESDPTVKAVRDASTYLRNVAIPAFIVDVMAGITGIMDGVSLTRAMHQRGINMRYLGSVVKAIKSEQGFCYPLKEIVIREMVFRACKRILRRFIRGLLPEHVPCAVAHFLNCLFGSSTPVYNPSELSSDEPEYINLTPESLRKEIISEVEKRFRYTLEEVPVKKQLLRELATRVGFQLLHRDYGTFAPSDILTMIPIVKSTAPPVSVAEEVFEAGRATMRENTDLGLEFLLEAVQLYENIHSVIHPEVAAVYNLYATTVHQLARIRIAQLEPDQPLGIDFSTALRLQRQAIIIAERTLGVYHPELATYYLNLAMLENWEGNATASLKYFRHLLTIWSVMGIDHPEINTILINAALGLQATNQLSLAIALLTESRDLSTKWFGPDHVQVGQALQQLTQSYFLSGDINSALSSAEKALVIFTNRYGEEHAQSKEAAKNIEVIKTVQENIAKTPAASAAQTVPAARIDRLKALQARVKALPHAHGANGKLENGTAANGAATNGKAVGAESASRIGERGHLDVDELVKFIQGQGGQGTGTGGAKRGKNALRGKRRTGAKR